MERRVREALTPIEPPHIGGLKQFRNELHPRDRSGKFARGFHTGAPKVGRHVLDVSSGLPKRVEVARVHRTGAVDVKDESGTHRLEPEQYHRAERVTKPPKAATSAGSEGQADKAWPDTPGVHPRLAAMHYSGPQPGKEGPYRLHPSENEVHKGKVGRYLTTPELKAELKAKGQYQPWYAQDGDRIMSGRTDAEAILKLAKIQHDEHVAEQKRAAKRPAPKQVEPLSAEKMAELNKLRAAEQSISKQITAYKAEHKGDVYASPALQTLRRRHAEARARTVAFQKNMRVKEAVVDPIERRVARLVEAGVNWRSDLHPRDRNGMWLSKGGMRVLKMPHGGIVGHVQASGGKFHAYSNYASTAYTDGHGALSGSAKGAEPKWISEHDTEEGARSAVEKYAGEHVTSFPHEPLGGYSNSYYDKRDADTKAEIAKTGNAAVAARRAAIPPVGGSTSMQKRVDVRMQAPPVSKGHVDSVASKTPPQKPDVRPNIRDKSLPEGYVNSPDEGIVPISPSELADFDSGALQYPANPSDFYGVYAKNEAAADDAERQKLAGWLNGKMPPGASKALVQKRFDELLKAKTNRTGSSKGDGSHLRLLGRKTNVQEGPPPEDKLVVDPTGEVEGKAWHNDGGEYDSEGAYEAQLNKKGQLDKTYTAKGGSHRAAVRAAYVKYRKGSADHWGS